MASTVKFGKPDLLMAKQIAAISVGYGVTVGNNTHSTNAGITGHGFIVLAAGQYNSISGQYHNNGWHIAIQHNGGAGMAVVDGFILNVDKRTHISISGTSIKVNAGKKGRPALIVKSMATGKKYLMLIQASDMANMVAPIVGQIAGL